jgi:hypothetical protein
MEDPDAIVRGIYTIEPRIADPDVPANVDVFAGGQRNTNLPKLPVPNHEVKMPQSVISGMGRTARYPRETVTTPKSDRLVHSEQPGFFMGPFATQQNMPGVTLATTPQMARRMVHSTASSTPFDVPRGNLEDLGLHVSNEPRVFNAYSDPLRNGIIDYTGKEAPRSYPMIQSTGGILSRSHGLEDIGPWTDPYMSYAKWADNVVNADEQQFIIERIAKEKYPDAEDPIEASMSAGDTSIYDQSDKEMNDILESHLKDQTPEIQSIAESLKRGDDPATIFSKWPAVDFSHPGLASMVMDPGTILPEYSPEGILARKWNAVQSLPKFNEGDLGNADWYAKIMEDRYQRAARK